MCVYHRWYVWFGVVWRPISISCVTTTLLTTHELYIHVPPFQVVCNNKLVSRDSHGGQRDPGNATASIQ